MTKPTIHFTTRSDRIRRARRDPLVTRLSALVIAGIVIAPVAVLIGHSHGHHPVQSGNLPGAAVGLTPGPSTDSTAVATTATLAPPASAAAGAIAPPAPASQAAATLPPTTASATVPPTAVTNGTLPATIPPPTTATTAADLSALAGSTTSDGSAGSGLSSGGSGGSGGTLGEGASQAAATTVAPAPLTTQPPAPRTTQPPAPRLWDVATIQQVVRNVFPDDQEEHALAIAYRESHFDPYAHNYCCTGLFQIYGSVHQALINSLGFSVSQLTDPYVNSVVAYALYKLDGWGPWGG